MSRKYLALCLYPFIMSSIEAKSVVECRVVTGELSKCNPYSTRFLVAKEIEYQKEKKKLIVDKTLPVPKKSVKVISVIDMIEKYVEIEKPIRYEGSENRELEALNIESPKDDNSHSLSRELELQREATLVKLQKMQDESYSKMLKESQHFPQIKPDDVSLVEKPEEIGQKEEVKFEGVYTIERGDSLSIIAK